MRGAPEAEGEEEVRVWGQVELRGALVTAGLTLCSWVGGVVWTRYNYAEDQRRLLEATAAATTKNATEIASVSSKVEQIRAAFDEQSRGQVVFLAEIKRIVQSGRPASGKRP